MAPVLVAVEGNIGAGKSVLLDAIASWLPGGLVAIAKEPIEEWTRCCGDGADSALGKFYSSPERHAMDFQVLVASSKIRDLMPVFAAPEGRGPRLVVCERDPYDLDIFPTLNAEEGLFDESHVYVLGHLMDTLRIASGVPPVSGTIYLRSSPRLCADRVALRNRAAETGAGARGEYFEARLKRLDCLHDAKFASSAGEKFLVLDASLPAEKHRERVVRFLELFLRRSPPASSPGAQASSPGAPASALSALTLATAPA